MNRESEALASELNFRREERRIAIDDNWDQLRAKIQARYEELKKKMSVSEAHAQLKKELTPKNYEDWVQF